VFYYDLCPNHFVLTKCRFLKGNYYSFMNQHQKEARLFFTQGCVPSEGESTPQAQPKGAVQEGEFEPESGPSAPPAAKTRGRPKGKQKAGK
jgi:centromere protein C